MIRHSVLCLVAGGRGKQERLTQELHESSAFFLIFSESDFFLIGRKTKESF